MLTKQQIEKAVLSKGYKWFNDDTNKGFDLNIVGIRTSIPGDKVTNVFDDFITISYKENGTWKFYAWSATTDPGRKAVLEFSNSKGVAILVPGQYVKTHIIRKHQGKYDALCQDKSVKVFRDKNKDMKFDMNPSSVEEGIFGINIHRSNPKTESQLVEDWSMGCQVFKRVKDFNEFMTILNKSKDIHGNRFTYTLLESRDIK